MTPETRGVVLVGMVAALLVLQQAGWPGLVAAAVVVAVVCRQRRPVGDAHGSAAFATARQLARAGMTGRTARGLFLGRAVAGGRLLFAPRAVHASVFAPPGAGKGAGLVIPTLLLDPTPSVILDPKGENFLAAAAYRERVFGRRSIRLDPFGVCGPGGDAFNPVEFIAPADPRAADQCRALANAVVVRTGQEHDPHFNDASEAAVHAFLLACVAAGQPEERTLGTVASLLADPDTFAGGVASMRRSDAFGGVLRRLGGQLAHPAERERGSILSTAARHLGFLNSPLAAAATAMSTFDPLWLKHHPDPYDLYLVLPPDQMRAQAGLVRYWLTGLIRRLCQGPPDESRPVRFLLDEAALLLGGQLQAVEDAVAVGRGWGLRLTFFWQAVGQVHDCFPGPKAATFLANMGHKIFFGLSDYDSAELVSKMLGSATVLSASRQAGDSYSRPAADAFGRPPQAAQWSTSRSVTHAETGRPLLRPEEVLGLDPRTLVVFTPDTPPLLARQVRYYEPDFPG